MAVIADAVMLLFLEEILALFTFVCIIKDYVNRALTRRTGFSAEVKRSEQSMNSLYIMYGTITVIYALAVQVAEGFKGYKVLLIFLNYLALTYMFFFSSWFRNRVFFRLLERIRRD